MNPKCYWAFIDTNKYSSSSFSCFCHSSYVNYLMRQDETVLIGSFTSGIKIDETMANDNPIFLISMYNTDLYL